MFGNQAQRVSATARCAPLNWWEDRSSNGSSTTLEVQVKEILHTDWCSIAHVDLDDQPHAVNFRRAQHTLLIYDSGSYVRGQRTINGTRMSGSGPLDGVDVVPAATEFVGLADTGSKIGCTVISIDPDRYAVESTDWGAKPETLRPAVGLKGNLLYPLAGRLRQISNSTLGNWDRLYVESAVAMLLYEVKGELRSANRTCMQSGGLSGRAQRTIYEYLLDNLDTKVNLETLADQVGLSRFHFCRAFKKSFGVPPYYYLMNLRIKKAAELLRKTNRSITDIALDVGFSGSAEFSRAFRQAMQCTPREFRAENFIECRMSASQALRWLRDADADTTKGGNGEC